MESHDQTASGRKRPYRKPQVTRVMLRAEEAVLGACKTNAGGVTGPGQPKCTAPSACSSVGS